MGFLAPILGGLAGSLGGALFGNAQNKANIQAQTNQQDQSEQYAKKQLANALANYQAYMKANPNPATQYSGVQGPPNIYGGSPGATVAQGGPTQMGGQVFNGNAGGQPGGAPQPQSLPAYLQTALGFSAQRPQMQRGLQGPWSPPQVPPQNGTPIGPAPQPVPA